jgi:hypothetical protein
MDFNVIDSVINAVFFAQQKTVSGVVSDSSGPVPGVNVVVKGTRVVYRLIWMAVILLKRKLEMI